ncbi:MAG: hypothetical protein N2746_09290 [Deltaproteobacteria bacterium]|nr:hypothetical protein [Deltaproteobacteria bacterium]
MNRFCFTFLCLLITVGGIGYIYGSENESIKVLQKKAFPLDMKLEVGFGGGISVADRYSQSLVPAAGKLIFHPFDFLGLGGFFLYTMSSETNLSKELRKMGMAAHEPERTRTKWLTGGELVVYPIYGKLSLFSEAAFNYHIYLSGGGGVGNIVATNYQNDTERSYGTKPVYTLAGGMQLHLFKFGEKKNKYVDLKFECRYFGYTVKADESWFEGEKNKPEPPSNSAQHRLVLSMAYLSFLF